MKIAAIQMVSGTRVDGNLAAAERLLGEAAAQGCELAVLPEHFCLLGRADTDKLALREPLGEGPIQAFLADRARALGLWIAGGTLPLVASDAGHVRNASLVFSPRGERVA
ncbi:MAG: nitrilase-related carbon-nitrogen hydrolase, partial [Ramlibacter sp.]